MCARACVCARVHVCACKGQEEREGGVCMGERKVCVLRESISARKTGLQVSRKWPAGFT